MKFCGLASAVNSVRIGVVPASLEDKQMRGKVVSRVDQHTPAHTYKGIK